MALAHLVALNDFGGLQTLYVSYAIHQAGIGQPPVTINRGTERPLTLFSEQLAAAGVIPYSPRAHPAIRLASATVNWSGAQRLVQAAIVYRGMRRIFSREGVHRLVCWNAIPSRSYLPPTGDCIVYDHGLSSIQKPNRVNRERLRLASEIIAISKANVRLLEERWGWRGKVQTIANPLREEIAAAPLMTRAGRRDDDTLVVGCASRLVSFKGIASLVHAVAILKSRGQKIKLRIAGDGPEAENLKQAARNLHAAEYIQFDGLVSNMPRFFSEIDIFVAPSLREPFGLSPLESLASGVPTILSNVDGHGEILPFADAATVLMPDLPLSAYKELGSSLKRMPEFVYCPQRDCLVSPRALDPERLADAMVQIASDYESHAARAAKAAVKIRQQNSMHVYASNFAKLTEKLEIGVGLNEAA